MNAPKYNNTQSFTQNETVLELLVKNHPGVMSHVCGLFSRRGYNLEGIAVLPIGNGKESRIWLKMAAKDRLEQVIKQLGKLPDVHEVKTHDPDHSIFMDMATHFMA